METAATIIVSCREAQKATTITQGVFSLGVMSPKPMVAAREARNRVALVTHFERFFFLCGRNVQGLSIIRDCHGLSLWIAAFAGMTNHLEGFRFTIIERPCRNVRLRRCIC